jgi:hypothetical protein
MIHLFQCPRVIKYYYCSRNEISKFMPSVERRILRFFYRIKNIRFQYSKTKVKNFLFNLLRIKGLYMFRALLADPQEALYKRHLVYCMRVMSVGCTSIAVDWCSQLTQHARNIPSTACAANPEDEQVMLETCTGP